MDAAESNSDVTIKDAVDIAAEAADDAIFELYEEAAKVAARHYD